MSLKSGTTTDKEQAVVAQDTLLRDNSAVERSADVSGKLGDFGGGGAPTMTEASVWEKRAVSEEATEELVSPVSFQTRYQNNLRKWKDVATLAATEPEPIFMLVN